MNFLSILRDLARAEVDFIVVGGVASVLQGAGYTTFDLDLVHSRDLENRARLHTLLVDLDACYREHQPKILRPTIEDLDSAGHLLLMTCQGPLDLLGTIGEGAGFVELEPHTIWMELGEGLRARVLRLEEIIRRKERTGREKDRQQLPLLRRTLEERDRDRGE